MSMNENNEYFQCFRVLLHIMKLFGIFPFIFWHRGTSNNLFISRTITLLSILFYLPLCAQQFIYVMKNSNLMLVNFHFNTFVRILPPVTGRVVFLLIPFMTWRTNERVYNHIKRWQKLQDTLTSIRKIRYVSPLKTTIPALNIIFLTFCVFLLLPLKPYFDLNMTISTSLTSFLYLGVALLSINLFWINNCLFVTSVAKDIPRLIKKSITSRDEETFTRLVKFWANLYDWNGQFTSTVSAMFLVLLSSMMVTLVTCFYTFTYLIVVQEDKMAGLAYFIFAISSFLTMLAFCESANHLLNQMVFNIQETLLTTNTHKMNLRLLEVISVFLHTIDTTGPKITVNGVVCLNRSRILSIFATSINFLIVLKQFNSRTW